MSLPLGRYEEAEIVDAIYAEIGEYRKPRIELVWSAIDPTTGEPDTESSLHWFTGGAKDISLQALRHLGWKPGEDLSGLIGVKNQINVTERTSEGKTYRDAKPYIPFGGGVRTSDRERKSQAAAKAFLLSLTAPPGADPLAAAAAADDDDTPF